MSNNDKEDKRAAIQLWTTVSTQLITATLAMMAVEGAFVTFFFDKRQPTTIFFVLTGLTLLLFIVSIGLAAKGMGALAQSGYSGQWEKDVAVPKFKKQTLFCLLGLVFFFASLFYSGPAKEGESENLVQLHQQIETLRQRDTANKEALEKLHQDYRSLQERVQQQIDQLKTRPSQPRRVSK